ncbi:MAG: 2-hydroxyacyl-CoA dehydratase family protein [Spirochaetota bacterium]|nr:2-hydroxyacyl-CoA dehydratase family protein [Spirochaetota bacterium]
MSSTDLSSSKKKLKTARLVWPIAKDYYAKARQAKLDKKPVIWTILMAPLELLHAMDVVPMMTEHFSTLLAVKQKIVPYLELAENLGYPRNICSFHRAVVGYALSGEELMIPEPDFVIGATNACDGGVKLHIPVVEHYKVPYYVMDSPFQTTIGTEETVEEEKVAYYREQCEELIAILEKLTNKPLDEKKLKETIGYAKQTNDLWMEISELRKTVPCPMSLVEESSTIYPLIQLLGTKEAVGFYQMLLKEVQERVKEGKGIIENEKHRLLWLGPIINYDTSLLNYVEEFGGVLVRSDMDYIYLGELDPDNPLDSLARKYIANFFNGVIENRVNLTKEMIRENKIDGVIMYTHKGCRLYCGGQKIVKDEITEEFGIPSLLIPGDLSDVRDYDKEYIRNQIANFMEMLG